MIPETREEMFLSAVTDGSGANLQPITREEMYLHAIATGGDTGLTPITRKEMFFDKILKSGGTGGSGGSTGGSTGGSGGSSVSVPAKEVNFYDYDGTLLHAYTVAEAQAMTELPALPERPGLICQGWNWTLEDIKAHNRAVNVGATYTTDDGTTRIYIHLEEGRTSPMLGVRVNGTVTVDWGDGSSADVLTGSNEYENTQWTPTHEYSKPGDYVIRLFVYGKAGMWGNANANLGPEILRHSASADTRNKTYTRAIKKVEIGDNMDVNTDAFRDCGSVETISLSNSVIRVNGSTFRACGSLPFLVIPSVATYMDNSVCRDCYSLRGISIPNSVKVIGNETFYNCKAMKTVTFAKDATLNNQLFYYCYSLTNIELTEGMSAIPNYLLAECPSLTRIAIPETVNTVNYGAFSNCFGVRYYDFTKHTAVPALAATSAFNGIAADCEIRVPAALYDEWIAATNWATYASYIKAV